MEKSVRTVFGRHESEKIIEKSRFITFSAHVESEEEARQFVAEIRSKHSLATHVCFAFISDKTGNLQRFSDDGEPQGTAGVPILEVGVGLSTSSPQSVRTGKRYSSTSFFMTGAKPKHKGQKTSVI